MDYVVPKKKSLSQDKHGKKSSYKKLLATIGLSITVRICQNTEMYLRQAEEGVTLFFLNKHISTKGNSCLILFRAVHSKRHPICLKKASVQIVWVEETARRHWVLLGPPIIQSNWRQKDQGNLLDRSQSSKRTCPQQNMREFWKSSTRSTRAAVSCCCLQQGITG